MLIIIKFYYKIITAGILICLTEDYRWVKH